MDENVLVIGENNVPAIWWGIKYVFTAKTAGTYIFNWGETAGVACIETVSGIEMIDLPCEITLDAYESFEIILCEDNDQNVDVIISKK